MNTHTPPPPRWLGHALFFSGITGGFLMVSLSIGLRGALLIVGAITSVMLLGLGIGMLGARWVRGPEISAGPAEDQTQGNSESQST